MHPLTGKIGEWIYGAGLPCNVVSKGMQGDPLAHDVSRDMVCCYQQQ